MIEQRLGHAATFSPCRSYRYTLVRELGTGPTLQVIGLNPSTADELVDDPTIRRCVGFARSWGFGRLVMTNLFAFGATDPGQLRAVADPGGAGERSDQVEVARLAEVILAAWGCHGAWLDRAEAVGHLLGHRQLLCLGETSNGQPRHLLYVPATAAPFPTILNLPLEPPCDPHPSHHPSQLA
jgi:hypothetical protein